jgi:hypothetical protein
MFAKGQDIDIFFFSKFLHVFDREARKTLPKPKVGDYCSIAMEQGFSDVCVSLCVGEEPVNRIVQACRHASMEQPRPTVRRWCEHGYKVAYDKTSVDLANHFQVEPGARADEHREEVKDVVEAAPRDAAPLEDPVKPEAAAAPRTVVATVSVTLDEEEIALNIYEGQSGEDAVVSFCREHVADEVSACIRQLLPSVLERLEEINAAAASAV